MLRFLDAFGHRFRQCRRDHAVYLFLESRVASGEVSLDRLRGMIGESPALREVAALTRRVAASSATVLVTGETGTGKELVARAIHELSPRASGPFVRVNCGALSESLLESELFGHVKGAFTNAIENRTGRFEAAHGGTIFLDEVNSMSHTLQVKLLRVLQEHEFERVGDSRTIQVDCRIVAATNRDLLEEVDREKFREDLYYRMNVISIYLPALRERSDDVPLLVEHFTRQYAQDNNRSVPKVTPEFVGFLQRYSFPGNVRELQNYIERAIVLSTGDTLNADLLPPHVRGLAAVRMGRPQANDLQKMATELVSTSIIQAGPDANDLHERAVSIVEREVLLQVLRSCQGIQTKTADRLGINRNTLHKKISDYKLESEAR